MACQIDFSTGGLGNVPRNFIRDARRRTGLLHVALVIPGALFCSDIVNGFVCPASIQRDAPTAGKVHKPQRIGEAEASPAGLAGSNSIASSNSALLLLLGAISGSSVAMRSKATSITAPSAGMLEAPSTRDSSSNLLPRVLLMLFALFCSTNFTYVKVLEQGHSEAAVAAVRFIIALLPFLPMIPKHSSKQSIVSGVEIGLWCTLGYMAQAAGLPYTDASKGAFLCSLTMLVVPLVKSLFGAKVQPQLWAAVALAVAGTSLLFGLGDASGSSGFGWGEFLCSGTALGFGLMFVRMDHYGKEPGFDSLGCTIWQVMTIAAAMTLWLFASSGPEVATSEVVSLLSSGPEVLGILAWVGLVTTAGVLYVETWAMEKVDGTEAGIIFASEPVWATLFASVVLGESFGFKEGLGGAMIVIACVLTQVKFEGTSKQTHSSQALETA